MTASYPLIDPRDSLVPGHGEGKADFHHRGGIDGSGERASTLPCCMQQGHLSAAGTQPHTQQFTQVLQGNTSRL